MRNYDTNELNRILEEEDFKGDIPLEIEENLEQLEVCMIDDSWELEGSLTETR